MVTITRPGMRTALRLAALTVGLVGGVFWVFGGPHLGWTRTSVPETKQDPVTEIEYVEWRKTFVPGLDFLGGTLGLAGVLFAASWFVKTAGRENGDREGA